MPEKKLPSARPAGTRSRKRPQAKPAATPETPEIASVTTMGALPQEGPSFEDLVTSLPAPPKKAERLVVMIDVSDLFGMEAGRAEFGFTAPNTPELWSVGQTIAYLKASPRYSYFPEDLMQAIGILTACHAHPACKDNQPVAWRNYAELALRQAGALELLIQRISDRLPEVTKFKDAVAEQKNG